MDFKTSENKKNGVNRLSLISIQIILLDNCRLNGLPESWVSNRLGIVIAMPLGCGTITAPEKFFCKPNAKNV